MKPITRFPKIRAIVGPAFVASFLASIACSGDGSSRSSKNDTSFRKDVIWCEDALARLEQCCPGFRTRQLRCTHYYRSESGCDHASYEFEDPALTESESQCIRDASCDAIVRGGVCERAQSVIAAHGSATVGFGENKDSVEGSARAGKGHAAVCP